MLNNAVTIFPGARCVGIFRAESCHDHCPALSLRVSDSDIISYSTLPRLLTVTTRGDPSQCSIIHGDMINHDLNNRLVLLANISLLRYDTI